MSMTIMEQEADLRASLQKTRAARVREPLQVNGMSPDQHLAIWIEAMDRLEAHETRMLAELTPSHWMAL